MLECRVGECIVTDKMESGSLKLFRIQAHLASDGYISVNENKTSISVLPATLNTVFMGHFESRNQVIITSFKISKEAHEPWINFDPLNVQYQNAAIEESNVL